MKQFNGAFFRDLWGIVKPYWWHSEERWVARVLLIAIVLLNLFMVYISYRITEWYNTFWNALQKYDAPGAWHQILVFVVLVIPYIVAAVYQTWLTQMLQIRWRQWLTVKYVDAWLSRGTYYQMQVLGDGTDNPDQRISQDLATFSSQTLNLFIGLISSVTTLAAFLAMLWTLSSQVAIPWHGVTIVIPGYLVWAAVLYSVCGTLLTAVVGRRLIHLSFDQERFNADFRFSLVRIRENSESIALYRGEPRERDQLLARFAEIFRNFWQIMRRTRRLNWWVSGYGQAAVIFPVLVSMPAYFAKVIQIGTIMQISSAFGQVQGALSFIVNSYTDLASWHAVVDRLRFFQQAMDKVDSMRNVHAHIERRNGQALRLRGVSVRLPDGRELVRGLDLDLASGGRLLVMGASGSGKSTLIRTLAGVWPFGEGLVELPESDVVLFMPQKPYLPLGSLRETLLYPFGDPATSDDRLVEVLDRAGLPGLSDVLSEHRMWSHVLSLGEQQRLAFGRIFLQRPAWVFMDEATSAIDEPGERALYERLIELLPDTAVVSVGHRSSLLAFHQSRLVLDGDGDWRQEGVPGSFMTQERRTTAVEMLLVLGVSLGYSAIYSAIDLIGKLSAHKALSAQTTTLNPSEASGRPGLDLAFQLARILFGIVPALLAVHLLKRSAKADPVGLQTRRIGFDVRSGVGLAAAIGIPGIALYAASRAIGINTTVIPEALPPAWWTIPVLLLSAFQNAFLEEVVVVGYLMNRLRELSWSVPLAVTASALLRGSYHLYQGFGGFIGNAVMGTVFALFFVRFQRAGPLIIAHAILDAAAFIGYALLRNHLGFLGL